MFLIISFIFLMGLSLHFLFGYKDQISSALVDALLLLLNNIIDLLFVPVFCLFGWGVHTLELCVDLLDVTSDSFESESDNIASVDASIRFI